MFLKADVPLNNASQIKPQSGVRKDLLHILSAETNKRAQQNNEYCRHGDELIAHLFFRIRDSTSVGQRSLGTLPAVGRTFPV